MFQRTKYVAKRRWASCAEPGGMAPRSGADDWPTGGDMDDTSGSAAATPRRGVVLLSGGLDSTTVLAIAVRDGYEVHALSFRYGQRHAVELEAARRVATHFGVQHHRVVEIDLRAFGGSSLTSNLPVPKNRDVSRPEDDGGIPSTYVPARNTIFLSFALAYAEVAGAADIFIGVNALDYSGYPDCRPEYVEAFERLANLATRTGVEAGAPFRVHAPLLHLTKQGIVELGLSLGVDYSMTTSCYDPADDGEACGLCDACQLRLRGFADNGVTDPIAYASLPAASATT
jgi:7-cyano-7-deazaguanine synthase